MDLTTVKSLVNWVFDDYLPEDYKRVEAAVTRATFEGSLYKGISWLTGPDFDIGDLIEIRYMTSWSTNEEVTWNYQDTGRIHVLFPKVTALNLSEVIATGEDKGILTEESEVIVAPCILKVTSKDNFDDFPDFAQYEMVYVGKAGCAKPRHILV